MTCSCKTKRPSAGLSRAQKASVLKRARAGKDIGKKGKHFSEIEEKAYKFYRSKGKSTYEARRIAKEVAGAQMWKNVKRKK